MVLTLDQARLINRALRYSIAHLNDQHQQAQREGRTHEAIACMIESEKLSNLKEEISHDISDQLKRASKGVAFEATTHGFTVAPCGVFSDSTPRDVNLDCAGTSSGVDSKPS